MYNEKQELNLHKKYTVIIKMYKYYIIYSQMLQIFMFFW